MLTLFLRAVRIAALPVACALALSVGTATAQDDMVARANRTAYQMTLKCYVMLAYASDERRRAGDESKSAVYESKARRSFDLSFAAGRKIGLHDEQVDRDLDFTQSTELPRLVSDQQYFLSTAATCKSVGLL